MKNQNLFFPPNIHLNVVSKKNQFRKTIIKQILLEIPLHFLTNHIHWNDRCF